MCSKISESFNKCFDTILSSILLDLTTNYNITSLENKQTDYNYLFKKYKLLLNSELKTCIYIKNNGTKCLNKTTCSKFCGIHKKHEKDVDNFIAENKKPMFYEEDVFELDLNKLQKKFINDSFYYINIEDKLIYDKYFLKVGYINNKSEYILE